MQLDIQGNRRARKYSRRELALRILWAAAQPLYRWSPRLLWGWRRALLRAFGARIGRDVRLHPRAHVFFPWHLSVGDEATIAEDVLVYNLGPVSIGAQATVSHGVQLCAGSHDYRDPAFVLLKPPVNIGDCAWICTEAFVGPGVRVGEGAVVGARAVVTRDVDPWSVVAGNPARNVGRRELRTAASG